jgi:hypothetical protein
MYLKSERFLLIIFYDGPFSVIKILIVFNIYELYVFPTS